MSAITAKVVIFDRLLDTARVSRGRERFSMPIPRVVGALAAGLVVLFATTAFASAAGAPEVITIAIDFESGETFTTPTGSLLCATGPAVSTQDHFGGNFNQVGTFHLTKLLDCGGGNTLTIKVDAVGKFAHAGGATTGGWSIVSGTGAFAGYNGGGHVVGVPGDGNPIDLTDHYYGNIH